MQRYNRNLNKEKIEILSKKVDTEETLLGQVEDLLKLSDADIARAIQATKEELDKVKSEETDRIVRQIKGKESSKIIKHAKDNSSINKRVYNLDENDRRNIYMLNKQINEIVEKRQVGEEVEDVDNQIEQIISLDAQHEKLRDMIKKLENFPKVRSQIVRIKNVSDKAVIKKNKNKMALESSIGANNQKIDELRKEQQKSEDSKWEIQIVLTGIMEKIDEIDRLTEELNNKDELTLEEREYLSGAAVKKQEYLAQKRKITKQFREEDQKEDYIGKIKALEEKNDDAKKGLESYNTGKSKEDGVINRCNFAIRMLYEGKTWDEIELASVEEIQKGQSKAEIESNKNPEIVKESESSRELEPIIKPKLIKKEEGSKESTQKNELEPAKEPEQEKEPETEKPKWYQFVRRFKNWNEKRKQNKLPEQVKEPESDKEPELVKEPEQESAKEPIKERDAFMSYLRDIAEKGDEKYLSKEDQKRSLSISNRDKERDE